MKCLILLVLFISSFETKFLKSKDVISGAVEIVEKYYMKKNENFDFIVVGSETRNLLEIVNDAARKINVPYEIKTFQKSESQLKINRSAFFLFDTLASYHNLHQYTVLGNTFPRNFYFTIFIDEFYQIEDVVTINDTKNPFRSTIFSQSSFLQHDNNSLLTLTTFLIFQQPNCRKWNAVQINQFKQNTWETNNFFEPKFTNFNGCKVVIRIFHPQPLIVNATFDENGVLERVYGCGAVFNEIISQFLNYSFIFNTFKNNTYYNKLIIDFEILGYSMRRLKAKNLRHVTTERYTTVDDIILLSKTLPYSQFEKIFIPFDDTVWYCLLLTMTAALLIILFLKLTPKTVQNFVFGNKVTTPLLNMINVSLGGGQLVLPGRNFARFLLMCFILFCLINRTAYISMQYEFMLKEMRPKDPVSINEMMMKNYTFFGSAGVMQIMKKMEFGERLKKVGLAGEKFITDLLFDGSNRGLVTDSNWVNFILSNSSGKFNYIKLNEKVMSDHWGFVFDFNHSLYDAYNKKIVQLVEAGLTEFIISRDMINSGANEEITNVVLTMDHLGIWFLISFFCICFASFVFALEILIKFRFK